MTFTYDERHALATLDAAFGPFDAPDPLNVGQVSADAYVRNARQYIAYAVDYWKHAALAANPDLPAIQQKLREERAREATLKYAERTLEKRENQVSGILAGLIPKARKAGKVQFKIHDWDIMITVEKGDEDIFDLTYDRETYTLDGHLKGEYFDTEDWTGLNGCDRPRDQSVALAAVLEYLEGLE